jgi:hypothetical protein
MTGEATGWGGELWAAADLVTPMAIRVAATLRLADTSSLADRRPRPWPQRWPLTGTRWGDCWATW